LQQKDLFNLWLDNTAIFVQKLFSVLVFSPSGLSRQTSAARLMLSCCYFLYSSFFFFFNDRSEQRDLGNYKTDLQQFSGVVDMLV